MSAPSLSTEICAGEEPEYDIVGRRKNGWRENDGITPEEKGVDFNLPSGANMLFISGIYGQSAADMLLKDIEPARIQGLPVEKIILL